MSTTGKDPHKLSPTTSAMAPAVLTWESLISVWNEGIKILPVRESSIRSSRILAILNEDGIAPPAIPEWTPSLETRTLNVPCIKPLRASVFQMWS